MKNLILLIKSRISPIIVGKFRYRYEYASPFGEYWSIYRLWFGFIPIQHETYTYSVFNSRSNFEDVQVYVSSLNNLIKPVK